MWTDKAFFIVFIGKDVDLYKMFRIVMRYGGHARVTNQQAWKTVASKLGFETNWCVNQVS